MRMGRIKLQLNFYLRSDGSPKNKSMKKNLFTCEHVNMALCGKMKKTKKKRLKTCSKM